MADFEVDAEELRRAGRLLRDRGDLFAESNSLKYFAAPDQVGDDELASALAELQTESRRTVDDLRRVAAEAAKRLADTAEEYVRRERSVANRLAARAELGDR